VTTVDSPHTKNNELARGTLKFITVKRAHARITPTYKCVREVRGSLNARHRETIPYNCQLGQGREHFELIFECFVWTFPAVDDQRWNTRPMLSRDRFDLLKPGVCPRPAGRSGILECHPSLSRSRSLGVPLRANCSGVWIALRMVAIL